MEWLNFTATPIGPQQRLRTLSSAVQRVFEQNQKHTTMTFVNLLLVDKTEASLFSLFDIYKPIILISYCQDPTRVYIAILYSAAG